MDDLARATEASLATWHRENVERQVAAALSLIPAKFNVEVLRVINKCRGRARFRWSAYERACWESLSYLDEGQLPNKQKLTEFCLRIEKSKHHAFWAELVAEIEYLEMLIDIIAP